MQCPVCPPGSQLEPLYVGDVEIDRCTVCRGVWLDRGELEKLRPARQDVSAPPPSPRVEDYRGDYGDDYERRPRGYEEPPRRRKKKGLSDLLEEILDL